MTFNTGNPIGSTDARDLSDNAENFDKALGTLDATWTDRLGVTRDSFEGRLAKGSFYRVCDFTTGYTLTNMRQTLEYNGHEYGWAGTFPKVVAAGATPSTSGGIGAGAWVDRTDLTLRSELAAGTGADLIGYGESTISKHLLRTPEYYGAIGDGVANDTQAFLAAQDATPYGSFVELTAGKTYKINITNWVRQIRGNGAVLQRYDDSTDYIINFGRRVPDWDWGVIDNVVFDGVDKSHTACAIGAAGSDPASAGRWAFHNCEFKNALHGLKKFQGNIGCKYELCHFYASDYGFYAEGADSATMHAGSDSWDKCHVDGTTVGAIYYKDDTDGFGQLTFNDVIIEGNSGMGLFIRSLSSSVNYTTFNPVTINNLWTEANQTGQVDFDDMGLIDKRELRFDGILGISINDYYFTGAEFNDSCAIFNGCRIDDAYTGNAITIVNNNSILTGNGMYHGTRGANFALFVESIQNGSPYGDLTAGGISYRMPIRSVKAPASMGTKQTTEPMNGSSPINFTGTVGGNTIPIAGGVLGTHYHRLNVNASATYLGGNSVRLPDDGSFYVASVNARLVSGKVSGYFGGGIGGAGYINLTDDWNCSVAVGRSRGQTGVRLRFVGGSSDGVVEFCDYQIVTFPTQEQAVQYANSRLFRE